MMTNVGKDIYYMENKNENPELELEKPAEVKDAPGDDALTAPAELTEDTEVDTAAEA
jgi:hypothetical protein